MRTSKWLSDLAEPLVTQPVDEKLGLAVHTVLGDEDRADTGRTTGPDVQPSRVNPTSLIAPGGTAPETGPSPGDGLVGDQELRPGAVAAVAVGRHVEGDLARFDRRSRTAASGTCPGWRRRRRRSRSRTSARHRSAHRSGCEAPRSRTASGHRDPGDVIRNLLTRVDVAQPRHTPQHRVEITRTGTTTRRKIERLTKRSTRNPTRRTSGRRRRLRVVRGLGSGLARDGRWPSRSVDGAVLGSEVGVLAGAVFSAAVESD